MKVFLQKRLLFCQHCHYIANLFLHWINCWGLVAANISMWALSTSVMYSAVSMLREKSWIGTAEQLHRKLILQLKYPYWEQANKKKKWVSMLQFLNTFWLWWSNGLNLLFPSEPVWFLCRYSEFCWFPWLGIAAGRPGITPLQPWTFEKFQGGIWAWGKACFFCSTTPQLV